MNKTKEKEKYFLKTKISAKMKQNSRGDVLEIFHGTFIFDGY